MDFATLVLGNAGATDFTILGMWNESGLIAKGVIVTLLIMSVAAIGISFDRFMYFRKAKVQSIGYIGSLLPLVSTAGRLREAVGLDQRWGNSPVARVIGTGINEFVRGVDGLGARVQDPAEFEMVVDASSRTMERVKERQLATMKRGLPVLATIASSSPFVGLFGTTFGIITAFQDMGNPEAGGGGIAAIAGGISEALMTTALGLAVAIIAVWFYNFFTAKMDDATIDLDETAGEVLDSMGREARGGLAPAAHAVSPGAPGGRAPSGYPPPGVPGGQRY